MPLARGAMQIHLHARLRFGADFCTLNSFEFVSAQLLHVHANSHEVAEQHVSLTRAFLGGPLVGLACCCALSCCMVLIRGGGVLVRLLVRLRLG